MLKEAEELRKKAAALVSKAKEQIPTTPPAAGSASQGSKPHPGTPRVVDYKPNPPVVVEFGGLIQKCLGCRKPFDRKKQVLLPDLIFKLMAIRPYPVGDQYFDKESPAFFHLNMGCLRMHNPRLQVKDVIIYDELLIMLKDEQKEQLTVCGLWDHLQQGM